MQLLESFKKYPFRQLTPPAEEANLSHKSSTAPSAPTSCPGAIGSGAAEKSSTPATSFSDASSSSSAQVASKTTTTLPTPPQPVKSKLPTIQHNPENGKQIPIGNGGYTEQYYWTQTLNEVTVYVDVPQGTRGKQVDCVMKPRFLSLSVKGQDCGPLMSGALEDVVRLDESMWTVASDDNSTQVRRLTFVHIASFFIHFCKFVCPHIAGYHHSG